MRLPQALISRVKILSGLNIAERRLPQDGVARQHVSRRRPRYSRGHDSYPTWRIRRCCGCSPRTAGLLEISKLGMESADEAKIKRLLALPHGMIIITGPTGSGKTTTLATMLGILNDTSRKILTDRRSRGIRD